MKRILIAGFLLASLPLHAASQEEDPSAKLREQLRSALLQIRKVQVDAANAQAAQAAAEAKSKDLEAKITGLEKQLATIVKQSNDDKTKAEEMIASLNNKTAERDKRIAQFEEALANWKDGYQKAAALARSKEEERAKLATEAIELRRTISDRETKNIALFNTSMEILDRFEKFSLGKALSAREPFIGKSRVTVENLVQGYKNTILDNRIGADKPKP